MGSLTSSSSLNPWESSFSSGTFPPVGGDHPGSHAIKRSEFSREWEAAAGANLDLEVG